MKHLAPSTVIAAALLAGVRARPSHACSEEGESGLGIHSTLPLTAAVAPTNTRIWVPQAIEWDAPAIDPATVVVTEGSTPVPVDAHRIVVAGDYERDLWVFTPRVPFTAGSAVIVNVGTEIVTQFLVEDAADLEPPALPVIRSVDVSGGYFGGFSCGDASRAVVTVADADALLVLAEGSGSALPDRALAVTDGRQLAALGLPEGDHTLRLLAVDSAGNTTVARVPDFTIPAEQSGCAVTSPGRGWPVVVALLAIVGLRRRRRIRADVVSRS
jgi:MYXO-CTERM domain-containing protein